jgi:hypothetical protein
MGYISSYSQNGTAASGGMLLEGRRENGFETFCTQPETREDFP